MMFEGIDNMVWSESESEVARWCKRNKVFDDITETEIEEIWKNGGPHEDEDIRLDGKYVWETAKRVCNYINTYEEIVRITTFGEYREVMRKVVKVIKEASTVEKKRRQSARRKKREETRTRTQQAKSLIADIRRGGVKKKMRSKNDLKRFSAKEADMRLKKSR